MRLGASVNSLDDAVLWTALKKGDEHAFAQLYQKYVRVLYSYGKKLTTNELVVEDTIQDLFIDIWQMRAKLADVECARFYLYRSLRRKIYKQTNKGKLGQEWEEVQEAQLPVSPSLEDTVIAAEIDVHEVLAMQNYLRKLPARQTEAIVLFYYEGFSFQQIAEIMMINEQSARNVIQRGLQKLRQVMVSNG